MAELLGPLRLLLKEKQAFGWEPKHQAAIEKIKVVLTSTQTMVPPQTRKALRVYIAVGEEAVCGLLAQEGEGQEKPIAYVSKTMKDVERRYPAQEKHCLALVYVAQWYRHYFQAFKVEVFTKDEDLKFLVQKPMITGRMSRWALLLSEYDISLVMPTVVRSQALADLLAICLRKKEEKMLEEIPGEVGGVNICGEEPEWMLMFNGTPSNPHGGAGVVLANEKGRSLFFMFKFEFPRANNEAEYEALILGLKMAQEIRVRRVQVRGDSNLVIKQVQGEYSVKEKRLALCREKVWKLMQQFEHIAFSHVPRLEINMLMLWPHLKANLWYNKESKLSSIK